jgi:hypothetical protein
MNMSEHKEDRVFKKAIKSALIGVRERLTNGDIDGVEKGLREAAEMTEVFRIRFNERNTHG